MVFKSKSKGTMGHTRWDSLPQAPSVMDVAVGVSILTSSHQVTQAPTRTAHELSKTLECMLRMKIRKDDLITIRYTKNDKEYREWWC